MGKDTFSIRMPDDVKEALKRVAEAEDRSMTQQIIRYVRMGLVDFEKNNPDFDMGGGWEKAYKPEWEKTFAPEPDTPPNPE